jgi:cysteine synthase A
MSIHDSILDTIGNTPIVRLQRLSPEGFELFAKLVEFNTIGSF